MHTHQIEIEYCTQCKWLLRAAWLAQELLTTFEGDLKAVSLLPGTGGVFAMQKSPNAVNVFCPIYVLQHSSDCLTM